MRFPRTSGSPTRCRSPTWSRHRANARAAGLLGKMLGLGPATRTNSDAGTESDVVDTNVLIEDGLAAMMFA